MNSDGNTPLDECQDQNRNDIVDIFDSFKGDERYMTLCSDTKRRKFFQTIRNNKMDRSKHPVFQIKP